MTEHMFDPTRPIEHPFGYTYRPAKLPASSNRGYPAVTYSPKKSDLLCKYLLIAKLTTFSQHDPTRSTLQILLNRQAGKTQTTQPGVDQPIQVM